MAADIHILKQFVNPLVKKYYWEDDVNCTTTSVQILSKYFHTSFSKDVLYAATGMHGAGKYGAQCGLVEGGLMFVGIWGKHQGLSDSAIAGLCNSFARDFEKKFGSLQCRDLRPEGFQPNNPPHLCEDLSCRVIAFTILHIEKYLSHQSSDTPLPSCP